MDDDLTKTLWLELHDATVKLRHPPPPRDDVWARGKEDFYGLLYAHGAEYEQYDGKHGETVRLRVSYSAKNEELDPSYDIWSFQHPRSQRHLFECGWTLAEFVDLSDIDASFAGVVSTDDDQVAAALGADGLHDIRVEQIADLSEADADALVISARRGDIRALRRAVSAHTNCRVVIWTQAKPEPTPRKLIEFYPANPAAPPALHLWLRPLVARLAKGQSPEAALRDVFRASARKRDGLQAGSIRLRNGASDTWTSLLYQRSYYLMHVGTLVRGAAEAPVSGRARVVVTPVSDGGLAEKALASFRGWLERSADLTATKELGDQRQRQEATWVQECRKDFSKVVAAHAQECEYDERLQPLWILQRVPDFTHSDLVLSAYVVELCSMIRLGTTVHLHLVVEDAAGTTITALRQIRDNLPSPEALHLLPMITREAP
jgi:hypothetical protein